MDDTILQTLLSWQFLVFGIAVAAVMSVLRTLIEYLMTSWAPVAKESKLWNELLLPILPVIIGSCAAVYDRTFPYPDGLTTKGGRLVFGLVAGLLSTLFYRVVKALIDQKLGMILSQTTSTTATTTTTTAIAVPPTNVPSTITVLPTTVVVPQEKPINEELTNE